MSGPRIARWPVMLIAAPAGVATWSGWVELGRMTGFGKVALLPGIADNLQLDTAITLPVGVEAYAMYAMYAALAPASLSASTRRFAAWSAAGALGLGMAGQVAYHLLHAAGRPTAPWEITTLVSCLPVLVLGMAGLLAHAVRRDAGLPDTRTETGPAVMSGDGVDVRADMTGMDIGLAGSRTAGHPDTTRADMETDVRTPGHPDIETDTSGADTEPDMESDVPVSAPDIALRPVTQLPGRDALAKALLAEEPDMSGAELGRRLGLSDRQGRRLYARVRGAA
jgi:hypothetical protein